MVYSLIFLILAAISNSVMDTLQFHFETSVFLNKNPQYWNPNISWKNKYVNGDTKLGRRKIFGLIDYPVLLTDGWHLFKSFTISFLILTALTFDFSLKFWYYYPIVFCIYKTIWGLFFELFYKYLLRKC
jgi:hypothetical protein